MESTRLFFEGFKHGLKEAGHFIGNIVNAVLLSIVFYVGVGSVAIVSKMRRKRFLNKAFKTSGRSYWTDSSIHKRTKEDYFKPF